MKITKLVHSCMIVELDGKKALVDPGNFYNGIGRSLAAMGVEFVPLENGVAVEV